MNESHPNYQTKGNTKPKKKKTKKKRKTGVEDIEKKRR